MDTEKRKIEEDVTGPLEEEEGCKAIGLRIRKLRKRQHLTQSDLAKKLHIAISTLSTIESGERQRYNLTLLGNLCRELNTTLDLLVFGKQISVENVIWLVDQLPQTSKQALAAYLEKRIDEQIGD